jgi:hypothetical protein
MVIYYNRMSAHATWAMALRLRLLSFGGRLYDKIRDSFLFDIPASIRHPLDYRRRSIPRCRARLPGCLSISWQLASSPLASSSSTPASSSSTPAWLCWHSLGSHRTLYRRHPLEGAELHFPTPSQLRVLCPFLPTYRGELAALCVWVACARAFIQLRKGKRSTELEGVALGPQRLFRLAVDTTEPRGTGGLALTDRQQGLAR